MRQLLINQFEKIASADINNMQLALHKSLFEDTLYPFLQGQNGVLGTGFYPNYVSALAVSLAAGTGFYYDSSQTAYSPKYRMIQASSSVSVTLTAADATHDRIDLICLAPNFAVTSTATRFVKTGGTGPITSQTVNKSLQDTYSLQVVAGTPSATPAVPALPSGYIAIAQAYVHANTGLASQADITDVRNVLFQAFPLTVVAGEDLSGPMPVYVSAGASDGSRTAGAIYPVDTSSANGVKRSGFIGFVTGALTSGTQGKVLTSGIITGLSGLTPGALYYANPTSPGGLTTTKPTVAGQFIVPVGVAVTGTQLIINPALSAYAQQVASAIAYPNFFATNETELAAAISNATSNGGGIICLLNSFSISSDYVIPSGVTFIGRKGGSIITVLSGGSVTLSDGVKMEDVWFTSSLSSGNMVNLSNNYSVIRGCQFTVSSTSTMNCVYVTGNSNRMYNNVFVGVAAETGEPYGINYAGGVNNIDDSSVFLP